MYTILLDSNQCNYTNIAPMSKHKLPSRYVWQLYFTYFANVQLNIFRLFG